MSAFAYFAAKINKINGLLFIRKIAKNWIEVALFMIGVKKTLTIRFSDGKSAYFKNKKEYFEFWNSEFGQNELSKQLKTSYCKIKGKKIELNYQSRRLYFQYNTGKQLSNIIVLINENFIKEQYKWLNVKGKDVVDVGANVGDTAIYFALKGAKHVYAFEPYPYSYNIAKKNIELNHLENKITLLNEGCGRSGFVTIKKDYENTGSTNLKNSKKGKKIKIESLDEIVKRFNLKHATLKLDCEGCEYALILNASYETLHAFDQIIMEYHYGYKNLVRRLNEAGFKVRYSLPKTPLESGMFLGLITASYIYK